ncbi:hypothetical protein AAH991_38125 [Microbispora sp. ZYX-F-249]|uniref:XRE family transcriptional regulator n=1 Tax=Microbispora maris TaxID=3144104 RepID=A0ABV0B0G4_9ACTN
MDTIEKLKQMSQGPARARAAHEVAGTEAERRDEARGDRIQACLVLTRKHGWTQARAARAAGLTVQNLFGSGSTAR